MLEEPRVPLYGIFSQLLSVAEEMSGCPSQVYCLVLAPGYPGRRLQ